MWNFALHDTQTGQPEIEFPAEATAGGQWAARLQTGGTLSGALQVRDTQMQDLGQAALHELSDPTGAFTLVAKCDGQIVSAGVVVDSDYDDDSGVLTLAGKGIGDVLWPARMTSGVSHKTDGTLVVTNRSASGAARAILARAQQWSEFWATTVDLPAAGAGDFSATWDWWEFRNIKELLDQVRKTGAEIHHSPYLTAAGVLRYSTTVAPAITYGTVPLVAGTPGSPVVGLKYRRGGQNMVTGVQYVGNGKGSGILTAYAGEPIEGVPIRDSYSSATEITDQDRLQAMADADYKANKAPRREFACSVEASGDLHPAMFLPGALIELTTYGNPVIPDGLKTLRSMSLTGNFSSRRVTPEVVPHVA